MITLYLSFNSSKFTQMLFYLKSDSNEFQSNLLRQNINSIWFVLFCFGPKFRSVVCKPQRYDIGLTNTRLSIDIHHILHCLTLSDTGQQCLTSRLTTTQTSRSTRGSPDWKHYFQPDRLFWMASQSIASSWPMSSSLSTQSATGLPLLFILIIVIKSTIVANMTMSVCIGQ